MRNDNLCFLPTVVVMLILLINFTAFATAGHHIAHVTTVIEGNRKIEKSSDGCIYRESNKQKIPLEQGSKLFTDDEVKTGSSQIVIQYADGGGEILIQGKTRIKLSINSETGKKTTLLKVGEIINRVKGNFEVIASGINGSVEGTEFYTKSRGGKTTFVILDGQVRVKNNNDSVLVKELEITRGGTNLALQTPKKASENTIHYIVRLITKIKTITATRVSTKPCFKTPEEREKAFTEYTYLVTLDPNDASAQHQLGNVYLDWQDYPRAIEHFQNAVSLNDTDFISYNNLGLAYSQQADYENAEKCFLKTISLNPELAQTYNNLAMIYYQKGDSERAVSNFNKALELNGNFSEAYNNLGIAYYKNNQIEKAEEMFKKALAVNPDLASPYNNMGNIYASRGKYADAEKEFIKAISLDPNDPASYAGLGNIYYYKDDYHSALTQYQKTLEIAPDYYSVYGNIGNCYFQMGNYAAAIERYKKVAEIMPDDPTSYLNLGNIYYKTGAYDEAMTYYQKASALSPQDVSIYHNLGNLYYSRNQLDKAIEMYLHAIQLDHKDPTLHKSLANVYSEKGDRQAAIQEYLVAIGLDQQDFASHLNLAQQYYLQGDYDQSELYNQKALAIQPEHPGPLYNNGLCFLRKGEFEKALETYKKALETDKKQTILDYAINDLNQETSKNKLLKHGHFILGILYDAKGNSSVAKSQYKLYIQKNPAGLWLKDAKNILEN